MNVAFDYDGVITANLQHYYQLASDFKKSKHTVYVITGANKSRTNIIQKKLDDIHFPYDYLICRPKQFVSSQYTIGMWKKAKLKLYDVDLWFDNEIKNYEKAGVDFTNLKTHIIRI